MGGYLRGSNSAANWPKRKMYTPQTNSVQQQLNTLKRKVGNNKAAKVYWRKATNLIQPSSAAGITNYNVDVTSNFIGDSHYHDYVNGDKYTNHTLTICGSVPHDVSKFRVIVYVPKIPASYFAPALSVTGYTSIPDPAAFWVLSDFFVDNPSRNLTKTTIKNSSEYKRTINLKRLTTVYNVSSSTVEAGAVKILLIANNEEDGSSGEINGTLNYMLCLSDK